jgi:acetyltransferase-like isoleucine patch superfamily enzyme
MLRRIANRLWPRPPNSISPPLSASSWERYRDHIRIHPTAVIAPSATVKIFTPPERGRICLEIGESSHIFSSFSILRPEATIRIGKRCQLGASSFVCAEAIDVGDDVLMAWGCTVMDNDAHALQWEQRASDAITFLADYQADTDNPLRNKDWTAVSRKPIILGNKSWVSFNSVLLKGVHLGERAIVGAASVVTRAVPPNTIVAGNPARIVRELPSPL